MYSDHALPCDQLFGFSHRKNARLVKQKNPLIKSFYAFIENSQNFWNFFYAMGFAWLHSLWQQLQSSTSDAVSVYSSVGGSLWWNATPASGCETEGTFFTPSCLSSFSHAVIVFWKTINWQASNEVLPIGIKECFSPSSINFLLLCGIYSRNKSRWPL